MNHPWDQANMAYEGGNAHARVHPGAGSVVAPVGAVNIGAPPQAYPPLYAYQAAQRRPLAMPQNRTAVFVLGLLSILCFGFGFILGPLALALASKDTQGIREGYVRKDGLLTAGCILATISSTIWALIAGFVMLGLFLAA